MPPVAQNRSDPWLEVRALVGVPRQASGSPPPVLRPGRSVTMIYSPSMSAAPDSLAAQTGVASFTPTWDA